MAALFRAVGGSSIRRISNDKRLRPEPAAERGTRYLRRRADIPILICRSGTDWPLMAILHKPKITIRLSSGLQSECSQAPQNDRLTPQRPPL